MIKFYPLVCGGISRNGEGLHRSQGAGMVINDIIVSFYKEIRVRVKAVVPLGSQR